MDHASTGSTGWSREMDRASILASVGVAAGTTPMKKIILFLTALLTATSVSYAIAQSAPVRGVGLLALNASESHSGPSAAGSRTMQIELPDSGGGGHVGARALRGGGDIGEVRVDAPSPSVPVAAPVSPGDPTTPTAPKRTNYRWQALVPGAIK